MIAGIPGFSEHKPPANPREVHDVGSIGEVSTFEERGITNFSHGYRVAQPICYMLIASDGRQVPAVSDKGILVVENTDNGIIEILLGLRPFAHLEYFPPFTLIFDSLAQMAAYITNEGMILNVDPAVCAQLLRDERVPRALLAPLGLAGLAPPGLAGLAAPAAFAPLAAPGFPPPPAMAPRDPFEVIVDRMRYIQILGRYYYQERYGSRIKKSLFGDIMRYRREALRVSTVVEYMPTATRRAHNRRNLAFTAWLREHTRKKRGGRRLKKTKTLNSSNRSKRS
jgi:hypothetical protein